MERKKHERNKRYGILLLLAVINWLAVTMMILLVDPDAVKDVLFSRSYLPMTFLIAGGLFWFFTIVFMSAKQAVMWTIGGLLFIYLRIWGMGTLLNAVLIFGLLGSLELYWWSTRNLNKGVAQREEVE